MTNMLGEYNRWLGEVQNALRSINMPMDDWQSIWPFDFRGEHDKGTDPDRAAMKANRYWWHEQNKSMGRECDKLPGCWAAAITSANSCIEWLAQEHPILIGPVRQQPELTSMGIVRLRPSTVYVRSTRNLLHNVSWLT